MATDRRKFLSVLALGVPATTAAMLKTPPFATQLSVGARKGSPVIPLDVVSGVSELVRDCPQEEKRGGRLAVEQQLRKKII